MPERKSKNASSFSPPSEGSGETMNTRLPPYFFPSRCFGSRSGADWQTSWSGNLKMGGLRNTVSSKPKLIVELKMWPAMPAKDGLHAPKSCFWMAVLFTFTLFMACTGC